MKRLLNRVRVAGAISAMTVLFLGAPAFAQSNGVFDLETLRLDLTKTIDIDGCEGPAVVDLPNINFENNSDRLTRMALQQIDPLARIIRNSSHAAFVVEGHASSTGSHALNWDLSRKRAQAVADVLADKNVASHLFSTQWFGETRPIGSIDPRDAANRRVAFVQVTANSALYRLATGEKDISFQIVVERQNGPPFVLPEHAPFQTGDRWIACVATSQTGYLTFSQPNADGTVTSLGTWVVEADGLVKVPKQGSIAVDPPVGVERLNIRFVPINAQCQRGQPFAFESIQEGRGRARTATVTDDKLPNCRCNMPGVICKQVATQHVRKPN